MAIETTRGTVQTPSIWVPKTNFAVDDKAQHAVFEGSRGRLEGGDDFSVPLQWGEGDLEFEVQHNTIAKILYALFGTISTGSFNSAYKHTLSALQNVQGKTLSLWLQDPYGSVTRVFPMSVINSFELSAELGELVKARVNFLARGREDWTLQTPTYAAAGYKFASQHVFVKVAANEAGLDAASRINVQSLTLNVERDAIRENSMGTVQPVDILVRALKVSGKLKLTYEDRTYRDYMLNGTTKSLRVALDKRDTTIGTTTPQVQIDLAKVRFFDWQPAQELGEVATQEVAFEALWDVSNTRLLGSNTFVVDETSSHAN